MDAKLTKISDIAIKHALANGADEAATRVSRARFVDLKMREGKVESLQASTSRGLSVTLYMGGRYSANSTGILEPDHVRKFVDGCLAMTRVLTPDPHRALPEPELYGPTEGVELDLVDPGYDDLDTERRLALAAEVEQAALGASDEILSVTSRVMHQDGETLQVHSNGFRGEKAGTSFYLGASVTARDKDGRRPEDHHFVGARHLEDLPEPGPVGEEASRRALDRRGAAMVPSARMPMLVENRSASRMLASLLEPMSGGALQQKRSCFEGKLGQVIAAPLLTVIDEPLLPRGLGSRTFNGEGLAAQPLPLLEEGSLSSYLIDVYYGRKLGMAPTTGSTSNLVVTPGEGTLADLEASIDRGILVTSFLGGNANPATGDFSFGVSGFLLENGKRTQPVGEMNITGNHTELWQRLEVVGADPFAYSSWRVPSLLFADVQFSGG